MCEESRAGGGLGQGGLATYQAGPPTHCLRSAVHSSSWLLFPGAVRHSMASAGTPRYQAQPCPWLQEGKGPGFALRLL